MKKHKTAKKSKKPEKIVPPNTDYLFPELLIKKGEIIQDANPDQIRAVFNEILEGNTAYIAFTEKLFLYVGEASAAGYRNPNSFNGFRIFEVSPQPINTSEKSFTERNSLVIFTEKGPPSFQYQNSHFFLNATLSKNFASRLLAANNVIFPFVHLLEAVGIECKFLCGKDLRMNYFDKTRLRGTEYLKAIDITQIYHDKDALDNDKKSMDINLIRILDYSQEDIDEYKKLIGKSLAPHELPKNYFIQ